jgi:hypothetical protein
LKCSKEDHANNSDDKEMLTIPKKHIVRQVGSLNTGNIQRFAADPNYKSISRPYQSINPVSLNGLCSYMNFNPDDTNLENLQRKYYGRRWNQDNINQFGFASSGLPHNNNQTINE